jgi:dGTPase
LGHSPFGHAGEDALNEKMREFGGFSHNAHTLKLVTKIETRFIEFEGLNLSWEMLEGVVKHNGAISDVSKVHEYIAEYNSKHDLALKKSPSLEAQISAISDDIAYNNHDLEDGLRADLFSLDEVLKLPLVGEIYQNLMKQYPQIRRELLVAEAKKRLTLAMVLDVIDNTKNNLLSHNINNVEDERNYPKFLVNFSTEMENVHQALKKFLMKNMYTHQTLNLMTSRASKVIGRLFDFYFKNPQNLPQDQREIALKIHDEKELAVFVSDYVAGMTDRFAMKVFERI